MSIKIRTSTLCDLPALLEIYNHEVLYSTSTFDLNPKTVEERREWFFSHNVGNHPLITAEYDGKVAGYASLSPYREKEAYKTTVELSVYVGSDFRGNGVASALMEEILRLAREDENTHTVISVITDGNGASVHLHEKFGFTYCGTMHDVGIKFGKYLNIVNFELKV